MSINNKHLFAFFIFVLSLGVIFSTYVVILNMNGYPFDDFNNYRNIYNEVSKLSIYNVSNAYREAGITYIYYILSRFDISYFLALKLIFVALHLLTFIYIYIACNGRVFMWSLLAVAAFVITNRLYIEGAFNFFRSWTAMHFFCWAIITYFSFFGKVTRWLLTAIFLLMAANTHLQATLLSVFIFASSVGLQKLAKNTYWYFGLCIVLTLLFLQLLSIESVSEFVSRLNANTTVGDDASLTLSLLYQAAVPFLCFSFYAILSRKMKDPLLHSKQFKVSFAFFIFSILIFSAIPLSIRFSCLTLLLISVLVLNKKFNFGWRSDSMIIMACISCISCLNLVMLIIWL